MKLYDKIIEIFVTADDFCGQLDNLLTVHQIESPESKRKRKRKSTMSTSEVITIMVSFHLSSMRNFKHYYLYYVQKHLQKEFPHTVSYNRFVELMKQSALYLALFLKNNCRGECTGISFIDSTPVKVCNNRRIHQHKVFEGVATRGKSSVGWFYGFKLHLVINDQGEMINFAITPANTDDRNVNVMGKLCKKLFGKLFGDKGYLSQKLFEFLFHDGIHLITKIRSNMKNQLMDLKDKLYLRKRAIIETVNDELKNICQIEHTRHRSVANFFTNLLSGLAAYHFLPKKPSIKVVYDNSNQLSIFQ